MTEQQPRALAVRVNPALAAASGWDDQKIELLANTICKGATRDELGLFLQVCVRTGLDPFLGEIYAVKRWDAKLGREVMAIQTGIAGYRKKADETREYLGVVGPEWTADGQKWVDVWLDKEPPLAARVKVLRRGAEPSWTVARWSSYVQIGKEGPMPLWRKMPDHMLAKCAEVLAFRRTFPAMFSALPSPAQNVPEPPTGRVIDHETGEILEDLSDPADTAAEQQTVPARQPAASAATTGAPAATGQSVTTAAAPQTPAPVEGDYREADADDEPPADKQMAAAGVAPLFPNQPHAAQPATGDRPSERAQRQAEALHLAATRAELADLLPWEIVAVMTAGVLADWILDTSEKMAAAEKAAKRAPAVVGVK